MCVSRFLQFQNKNALLNLLSWTDDGKIKIYVYMYDVTHCMKCGIPMRRNCFGRRLALLEVPESQTGVVIEMKYAEDGQ